MSLLDRENQVKCFAVKIMPDVARNGILVEGIRSDVICYIIRSAFI
jgi:hypothetical protein